MKKALLDLLRQKIVWLAVITLLIALNLVALLVIAVYQNPELEQKTSTRNELRRNISAAERKDSTTLVLSSRQCLDKLQGMIPSKRQFPSILGDIMEAASSCNVSLSAMAYKPATIKEFKLRAYDVTLSATGRYGAVKSFLFDLQILEGLVVVDGISFSNESPYLENVTMETRLMIYLRDEA